MVILEIYNFYNKISVKCRNKYKINNWLLINWKKRINC